MTLHQWITERVKAVERTARTHEQASDIWEYDDLVREVCDFSNGGTVAGPGLRDGTGWHIAAQNPQSVLRRCEADQRVLARHRLPEPGHWMYPACEGCGTEGDRDAPVTDNINDCPELLDLAHAHGITETELKALHRLERVGVVPVVHKAVTPVITTDQVPPALRGARWQRHRH